MTRLLLPVLGLLCLLISGCGGTFPGAGSPPPVLLLKASGTDLNYISRKFTAPSSGWHVTYKFNCAKTPMIVGHGYMEITGIDANHPNSDELGIVYALGPTNGGTTQKLDPGSWKLHIMTEVGCTWRVQVRGA
jgi:hypothetical protein